MAFAKLLTILALASLTSAGLSDFHEYMQTFNKNYASSKEMLHRRLTFEANLKKIAEHNVKYERGEVTFSMGINQFTDMTSEERKAIFHGKQGSFKILLKDLLNNVV